MKFWKAHELWSSNLVKKISHENNFFTKFLIYQNSVGYQLLQNCQNVQATAGRMGGGVQTKSEFPYFCVHNS